MSQQARRPVAVIGSGARALPAHLNEALDVCLRLGVIPVMLEHPAEGDPGAVEAALSLFEQADVYIGFVGGEYGRIVPGHDRSIAEMEYDRALERGIPRLMFTAPGDAKTKAELDAEGDSRLEGLIRRVSEKQVVRHAGSPEEFSALLLDALVGLRMRDRTRAASRPPRLKDTTARKKGGGDGNAKTAKPRNRPAKMNGEPKLSSFGKYNQTFRVFVASPKDVHEERSCMPKVVESLNRTLGKLLQVTVELWRWESDAHASAGEPQAVINVELDEADVVLVIFWNRFGMPTSAGTTGTESEVLRSLERWSKARRPQVMIYFCQRPALLDRAGLEQRLKLLDLRERIAPLALAVDYKEVEEFKWRVRDDLFTTIARLCVKKV